MAVPILSRSQRRMEKKQALILLALVLGVSLVSFTLGVMVGKGSARPPVAASPPPERLPVAPPPAEATVATPPPAPLTFYDTLPRGEQPPLGSGINLPPGDKASSQPAPAASTPPSAKPVATPLPSAAETVKAAAAPATGGSWVVQAASFREAVDARRLQERLAGKGYAVMVQEADLGTKGKWFRVVVGPFSSQAAADQAAVRLKSQENLSTLVRRGG